MGERSAPGLGELVAAGLNAAVAESIRTGDLEGHLCALVLRSAAGAHGGAAGRYAWGQAIGDLLETDLVPPGPLRRTHDVAAVGVRLALGVAQERAADYGAAAKVELAREPLPPAACVRNDERFLLGVSAGVGAAAPELANDVSAIVRRREGRATRRGSALDAWAESLARGEPLLGGEAARRAYARLALPLNSERFTDGGRVAEFWISTRLLSARWNPTDDELATVTASVDAARSDVFTRLLEGFRPSAFDAALLLDGLCASPAGEFQRRTVLGAVLGVIDYFPACVEVLVKRKRGRPPFEVKDEYDAQDLFHALTLPLVPDMADEDPAPKVAGKSSRLDFTSKSALMGFELKYVRDKRHAARVRGEILIDEATYQEHPYVETVVALVYDPNGHIPLAERPAFEDDLSRTVAISGRTVRYFTRVR